MPQTNVTYYRQSRKLLARFQDVEAEDFINHKKIDFEALSTSLKVKLECGCIHVEHFSVYSEKEGHNARHYVELCDKHKLSQKELEA